MEQKSSLWAPVDARHAMNGRAAARKVLEYMAIGKPVIQFPLEMRTLCGDSAVHARDAGRERAPGGLTWHQQVPSLIAAIRTASA